MNDARKRAIQEMRDFYPHQLRGSGDEFVTSYLPGMVLFAERAIRAEDALAEAVRLIEWIRSMEIVEQMDRIDAFLAQRGKIGGK